MAQEKSYQQRRQSVSATKKREVLRTAGRCFAEAGYKQTAVEQIAAKAGVSKGLVFHFFHSKQELYDQVLEDAQAQWEMLSEHRASETSRGTAEELRSLFLASFEFVEQHPIALLFMHPQEDSLFSKSFSQSIAKQNRRWRRRVEKTLQLGIKQGEFRQDIDLARTTRLFHEFQISLIQRLQRSKNKTPDSRLIEDAADMLIGYVLSPTKCRM